MAISAFHLEWAIKALPLTFVEILSQDQSYFYASLTFLHNAQWGLEFSAQNFQICFAVTMGSHLQTVNM